MNRRHFLQSILAAGVAPYVARAESLMRGRVWGETASGLAVPSGLITIHAPGLQAGDIILFSALDGMDVLNGKLIRMESATQGTVFDPDGKDWRSYRSAPGAIELVTTH